MDELGTIVDSSVKEQTKRLKLKCCAMVESKVFSVSTFRREIKKRNKVVQVRLGIFFSGGAYP